MATNLIQDQLKQNDDRLYHQNRHLINNMENKQITAADGTVHQVIQTFWPKGTRQQAAYFDKTDGSLHLKRTAMKGTLAAVLTLMMDVPYVGRIIDWMVGKKVRGEDKVYRHGVFWLGRIFDRLKRHNDVESMEKMANQIGKDTDFGKALSYSVEDYKQQQQLDAKNVENERKIAIDDLKKDTESKKDELKQFKAEAKYEQQFKTAKEQNAKIQQSLSDYVAKNGLKPTKQEDEAEVTTIDANKIAAKSGKDKINEMDRQIDSFTKKTAEMNRFIEKNGEIKRDRKKEKGRSI